MITVYTLKTLKEHYPEISFTLYLKPKNDAPNKEGFYLIDQILTGEKDRNPEGKHRIYLTEAVLK